YSPGGALNALATALPGSIPTTPSAHCLQLGLTGYLHSVASLLTPEKSHDQATCLAGRQFLSTSRHCWRDRTVSSPDHRIGACVQSLRGPGPSRDQLVCELRQHHGRNERRECRHALAMYVHDMRAFVPIQARLQSIESSQHRCESFDLPIPE